MNLLIGLGVAALMSVAIFTAIVARVATRGLLGLVKPALFSAPIVALTILYYCGAFDTLLWNVLGPSPTLTQMEFLRRAESELNRSIVCAGTLPVEGWLGVVDYKFYVSDKLSIGVRIGPHIELRSAYVEQSLGGMDMYSRLNNQDVFKQGDWVRIDGSFIENPSCSNKGPMWEHAIGDEYQLLFKFSSLHVE